MAFWWSEFHSTTVNGKSCTPNEQFYCWMFCIVVNWWVWCFWQALVKVKGLDLLQWVYVRFCTSLFLDWCFCEFRVTTIENGQSWKSHYVFFFMISFKFLLRKPKILFTFAVMYLIWVSQDMLLDELMPKYFAVLMDSKMFPFNT